MDAQVQKRQGFNLGLPGLTDIFPDPAKDHSTSASATSSSSSVSASATDSSSSSSSSSFSSSSSSSSSSSDSSTSSTPEVTPTPSPEFSTSTTQSTRTVIAPAADASTSAQPSASPTHTAFLQNKVLSGLVFALVGVVGLVVVVSLLTFFIRRKRTRRFVEDAVSFDPVKMGGSGYPDAHAHALEAGRQQTYPRSSTSTGRASSNGNGPEIRQAAPFADYVPPPPPPPPPHSQMYNNSSASLRSYQSQQQQASAYSQPFNWAAPPPQSVHNDPYRGPVA